MPNTFAYVALFAWPVVVFLLFRALPRAQALIWSILGGYLLLPFGVGVDFPMLPTLDKVLIPSLAAAVMLLLSSDPQPGMVRGRTNRNQAASAEGNPTRDQFQRRGRTSKRNSNSDVNGQARTRQPIAGAWIEKLLILLLLATPFLTVVQNSEPYFAGTRTLPGLQMYDALSMILTSLVAVLPYLLARRFLTDPRRHMLLLTGLCIGGLLYSLPALFEVRMSPQLARWTYGFLAQSFLQAMRDDSFRPVVFLQHGLWLAIFIAMSFMAGLILWRWFNRDRRWLVAAIWLLLTLALCHSLGALSITILLAPVAIFLPIRMHLALAAVVALVIIAYPMLRGADLVPTDLITEIAGSVSAERADSLDFRLRNEDILLEHANAKPLAGWGGWGRSRVYNAVNGDDISTTDGMWIIVVGVYGWLGYLAQFGLLTLPVFLLAFNRAKFNITLPTSGLALVLAINLIDMIPNATLTPITWMIAGALMGYAANRRTEGVASTVEQPIQPSIVRKARSRSRVMG